MAWGAEFCPCAVNFFAEKVVKQTLQGDKDGIAEIGNRWDGKAMAAVNIAQDGMLTMVNRCE